MTAVKASEERARRAPVQERSRRTVQQILDAAEQIVGEQGVDAATTRTIAERAGVAAPSLYRFFADRDQILDALLVAMLSELEEAAERAEHDFTGSSIEEYIRLEIDLHVAFYERHPSLARLWFGGRVSAPVVELVRAHNHALAVRARQMLARASLLEDDVPEVVFDLLVEYGDRTLEAAFRGGRRADREVLEAGIVALSAFLERYALPSVPQREWGGGTAPNETGGVMSEITGGELFARALQAEGVEFLFGLPSPEVDPLLAELEEHGIRLVPVRHEAAGVHMAEGLYKTTGKVAAVLGNPGPGSANLLAGVVTALHEGIPVLAITSQHRLGIVYPSPPSTFQGQDQLELFRPAVKWGGPIFEWARIPEVVRLAFREMWNGRPGPVHIELPAPVLYETGAEEATRVLEPRAYRAGPPQPSAAQLDAAAELLAGAEHPVVIAGAGVDRAGAGAAAQQVAEILDCPLMCTMAGRASARSDHPNFVFGFGPAGDRARADADVLLVAGSRMGNLDVPFDAYWGDPEGKQLIQIDIDPRHFGVTRPLGLGIVADARMALEGIVQRLRERALPPRDGGSLADYRSLDEQARSALAAPILEWQGPGIHPAHALGAIGAFFGSDAVYTVDGGNTSLWAYNVLPPTRPRSYHSILELGMLGTGIPAAVGAKLGAPEREVVCVTGDGAAGFHVMEMQSAAREGLAITVIVFAEGAWTMEEINELDAYGTTFGTAQGEIRWDRVAEGLGCHGEYVERIEDLDAALQRSRSHAGPSLICVRSDHGANLAIPEEMMARFFEVYNGPAIESDAVPALSGAGA